MKTAKEIQRDIADLLRESVIAGEITGRIYPEGLRPRGKRAEDLEVVFTEGHAAEDDIEEGTVTLLIYTADIPDPDDPHSGALYEDARRTYELERLLADWLSHLTTEETGGYLLRPASTISTHPLRETREHFVSCPIRYKHYDN